jgi:hypothetical protein
MEKHWSGYLNAVGGNTVPKSSMPAPFATTDSTYGTSGFLDLKVERPDIQARYDAMSGSWGGVKASESAVNSGLFKAESMPVQNTPASTNNNVK